MEMSQDKAKQTQIWKELFSVNVKCPAPSFLLFQSLSRVCEKVVLSGQISSSGPSALMGLSLKQRQRKCFFAAIPRCDNYETEPMPNT